MGCDIHIYPEWYSKKDQLESIPEKSVWIHSACSEFHVGRNYELFSIMAQVRGASPFGYSPRGLPDDPAPGFDASYKYKLIVIPDEELKESGSSDFGQSFVAKSIAENWKTCLCYSIKVLQDADPENRKREEIMHPDYHSHSWLTTKELFHVRQIYLREQIEFNYSQYDMTKKKVKPLLKKLDDCPDPIDLFNINFGNFEYTSLNALIGMLYSAERTDPDTQGRIVFWFDS